MAKRRKKKRRSRKKKALLKILPLVAGAKAFIFPFYSWDEKTTVDLALQGDIKGAIHRIIYGLTGFDIIKGTFKATAIREGLLPLVVAGFAGKILRKFGVNRELKKATMGMVELV